MVFYSKISHAQWFNFFDLISDYLTGSRLDNQFEKKNYLAIFDI